MWGHGRNTSGKLGIAILFGLAVALWFAAFGSTETAEAQIVCEPGTIEVGTAADLNAAITCHNESGNIDIALTNDIEADSLAGDSVFTAIRGGGDLTIDGAGFTIRRATNAPTTPGAVLALIDDAAPGLAPLTDLWLVEIGIEVGPSDTAGILHEGHHELRLQNVSITAGAAGSAATGVVSNGDDDGQLIIIESLIDGVPTGIELSTLVFVMEGSTIRSTGIDLDVLRSGPGGIINSTLAGPVGLQLTEQGLRVENSTILGDGAAVSAAASIDSFVTFKSSIVNTCSADEFLTGTQPGPGWADLGNNAGSCFDPSAPVSLPDLGDNGCLRATPAGCPKTFALVADSPALGAGNCSETSSGVADADQRGEARTPVGAGCDAGAYEAACVGTSFEVSTVGAFNATVGCFNSATADPGSYTVSLMNDLVLTSSADGDSFTTSINQPGAGFALLIEGNGHRMFHPEPLGISNGPPSTFGLIAMNEANRSPVEIRNIVLETERDPDVDYLLWNKSPADLSIRRSSLFLLAENAITSTGGGDLIIEQSSVSAGSPIVRVSAGSVAVAQSTLNGLEADPGFGIVFEGSGAIDISNSTFVGGALFADLGVSGTLSNSTVTGDGVAGAAAISIESSIVESCGPAVIDRGNNVGGCFGAAVDVGTAADNGCAVSTPTGCPFTFALLLASPAVGAGDCTGLAVDQRGAPRTPIGVGCDAGAFERGEFLPGDVNADDAVDNADVQALLIWLAGGVEPANLAAGDVTGDAMIGLADALAIAQEFLE